MCHYLLCYSSKKFVHKLCFFKFRKLTFFNQFSFQKLDTAVSLEKDEYNPSECSKCYTIAHHMEHKFGGSSRDNVLERLLNICGEFSSFSDACSSIVLTHFETIYTHLQNNLNAQNVCHLSGQCSSKFHVHEDETDKVNLHDNLNSIFITKQRSF